MLNQLAIDVHAQNVEAGWWDDYLPDNKGARFEGAMMLTISEVAEAMEGHRKNLMDDHLPAELMFDVELADAMIRLFDLAGALEVDLDIMPEHPVNFDGLAGEDVPDKLYRLCRGLCQGSQSEIIRQGIYGLYDLAVYYNVDIWRLIHEKREYNKTRADHKRENRAKEGGKKF